MGRPSYTMGERAAWGKIEGGVGVHGAGKGHQAGAAGKGPTMDRRWSRRAPWLPGKAECRPKCRGGSGVWDKGEGWTAIYRQEALDMSANIEHVAGVIVSTLDGPLSFFPLESDLGYYRRYRP
jgi:hypothetical protein